MNALLLVAMTIVSAPERPVRVGIAPFEPMIQIDVSTGEVSGSDHDMFESLVDDIDINWSEGEDYEYVPVPSFGALMSKVKSGEVDMALNGISITHDRLGEMNFSQPYLNTGQRIMVPNSGPESFFSSIVTFVSRFARWEILISFLLFVIACILWGIPIVLAEKIFGKKLGKEPNITSIEEGSHAAADAATTIGYGRFFPITLVGNFIALAAFFTGQVLVSNVTSLLATERVLHRLEGEINEPQDLQGKTVAVIKGTTSERLVSEYNPKAIVACEDFFKAVVQLRLGEVEAVVADDPVVLSYLQGHPDHGMAVGTKFHSEDYGIAFAPKVDQSLVKQFSIAIARLRESGKLAVIEKQWFGEMNE